MTTSGAVVARPWVWALVLATRPRQWVKNLLVFAAPVAGGAITNDDVFWRAAAAGVAFVLASSACYLINDIYDADRDRLHPEKRHRPIAANQVNTTIATVTAAALLVLALGVALAVDREGLTVALLGYMGLTIAYSSGGKNVPGLELLMLAAGFVLRAVAGAAATAVQPSNWFLGVCCLAALMIAIGKRQAELTRLGWTAAAHRATLAHYSTALLRRARIVTAVGMVVAYSCWAMTRHGSHDRLLAIPTLLPVIAACVRLGRLNDRGEGDAPELVLYRDAWMLFYVVSWLVLFAFGPAHV